MDLETVKDAIDADEPVEIRVPVGANGRRLGVSVIVETLEEPRIAGDPGTINGYLADDPRIRIQAPTDVLENQS